MIDPSQHSNVPLQIRTPCPKSWSELSGDGKQRFCSQCSLHVHDGAQLTRDEARQIVTQATSRVCMRLQYDASGAPLFKDVPQMTAVRAKGPRSLLARAAQWGLSAAASVLAACDGSVPAAVPEPPPVN